MCIAHQSKYQTFILILTHSSVAVSVTREHVFFRLIIASATVSLYFSDNIHIICQHTRLTIVSNSVSKVAANHMECVRATTTKMLCFCEYFFFQFSFVPLFSAAFGVVDDLNCCCQQNKCYMVFGGIYFPCFDRRNLIILRAWKSSKLFSVKLPKSSDNKINAFHRSSIMSIRVNEIAIAFEEKLCSHLAQPKQPLHVYSTTFNVTTYKTEFSRRT